MHKFKNNYPEKFWGYKTIEENQSIPDENIKKQEAIDHPIHYKKPGISESIDIIIALGYGIGFCIGNALKYLYRAGMKDKSKYLEDLKKAKWYLDKAIELIEKGE